MRGEVFISVDIEAAGPIPGEYSMLSLGACPIDVPEEGFYVELRPITDRFVPQALQVGGLSLEHLSVAGVEPSAAMIALRDWVLRAASGRRPVFVGYNASFDWSFVNWYCHKYLGENPFGIGSLDIKAYYMGFSGSTWGDTASSRLPAEFQSERPHTHNALDDARTQAEIFSRLLTASRSASRRQGERS